MTLHIPDKVNLYDEMKKRAKLEPKKVIVEDLTNSLTYKHFLLNVNVLSQKIKERTRYEKRLGLLLPNVVGEVVVLFSLFKNEQDPCILNFTMDAEAIADCVETASLKTIITSKEFIKTADLFDIVEELEKKVKFLYLEELTEIITISHKLKSFVDSLIPSFKKRKQGNIIVFTSGTESKPKGVVLSHKNIYANIQQALEVIKTTEEDRIFNPLPLFHTFGLTVGALLPFIANIKTFLYPSPLHYKEIPKRIKKDKSTILIATNTFLDNYSKFATKEQLHTLRYVIAGAEKLKEDVKRKYLDEFGITLLEGYGATETSPIIALNTPENHKEQSVGKLLPLMDYKIDKIEGIEDGGNLLLKGPNVMEGYLINGKGFIPLKGWYNTGDIVRIDEEGYVFIQSRLKRFAKIAGEMVSLNKIEDLAFDCFGESAFYAVSIPDKRKGEKIILYTIMKDASEKEFKKFIKHKKISSLYIPYKIEYIDEVPLLQSGKTNYRLLEEQAKSIKKGLFS